MRKARVFAVAKHDCAGARPAIGVSRSSDLPSGPNNDRQGIGGREIVLTHIRRTVLGATVMTALSLAASASAASAETTLNVGKAQANADSIITVDVGVDHGIFQKHGLDLKVVNFSGGSRIVQALTAGSLDIAIGAGTQMSFVAKGAPMIAVCE